MAEKSNYEKMLAGEYYEGIDPALSDLKRAAATQKAAVDAIPADDMEARSAALEGLFGSMGGPCVVVPPFFVEYGVHIHLGKWVYFNSGATLLDSNTITIGDYTAVGPNVQFLAAGHPKDPDERFLDGPTDQFPPFRVMCVAKPIELGKKCWIGGGAIIMAGVTIGDGTMVGAGSVVTKSLPPMVTAVGNPARVIGPVDGPSRDA